MASAKKVANDKPQQPQKGGTQNPLFQRRPGEEQDRRRQVYLKKVRQVGEDKKWESRSEQILRADFLSRQKQWELEQARSAPEAVPVSEDEEKDSPSTYTEVDMVDHMLLQEDQEFEALVSSMEDQSPSNDHDMSNYGSDDEDYDNLFMEVILTQRFSDGKAEATGRVSDLVEDGVMDMS